MFVKVNDTILNTDQIQYLEVKSEGPFFVNIHFNVGCMKRIKFRNLYDLNDFLGKLDKDDHTSFVYANAV